MAFIRWLFHQIGVLLKGLIEGSFKGLWGFDIRQVRADPHRNYMAVFVNWTSFVWFSL